MQYLSFLLVAEAEAVMVAVGLAEFFQVGQLLLLP
jgi:hypothetical protein